jgi:hypothetical protein
MLILDVLCTLNVNGGLHIMNDQNEDDFVKVAEFTGTNKEYDRLIIIYLT